MVWPSINTQPGGQLLALLAQLASQGQRQKFAAWQGLGQGIAQGGENLGQGLQRNAQRKFAEEEAQKQRDATAQAAQAQRDFLATQEKNRMSVEGARGRRRDQAAWMRQKEGDKAAMELEKMRQKGMADRAKPNLLDYIQTFGSGIKEAAKLGIESADVQSRIEDRKARAANAKAKLDAANKNKADQLAFMRERFAAYMQAKTDEDRAKAQSDLLGRVGDLENRKKYLMTQLPDARMFSPEDAAAMDAEIKGIGDTLDQYAPILNRIKARAEGGPQPAPGGRAAPGGATMSVPSMHDAWVGKNRTTIRTAVPDAELKSVLRSLRDTAKSSGAPVEQVVRALFEEMNSGGVQTAFPSFQNFKGKPDAFLGALSPSRLATMGAAPEQSYQDAIRLWTELVNSVD